MFVIRSKKTGKTFLRLLGNGMHDWVMFREEKPTLFAQRSEAQYEITGLSPVHENWYEVVGISEVPKAEPDTSALDAIVSEKPEAWSVEIARLEKENARLRKLLADILQLSTKTFE